MHYLYTILAHVLNISHTHHKVSYFLFQHASLIDFKVTKRGFGNFMVRWSELNVVKILVKSAKMHVILIYIFSIDIEKKWPKKAHHVSY